MAHWLDTVFYGFDYAILEAIHSFALSTNGFFTPLVRAITVLADDGIGMILLGLILSLFRRTRKIGFCVLGGIMVGALITNVAVKNLVARPRPFADQTRVFYEWWQTIGAHPESIHSFPSGHTTATMAAMTGIFLTTKKRYSWPALLFALVMGFTRMYLVVHYPTDVLAGLIAGVIGAIAGFYLIKLVYRYIDSHGDNRLVRFYLNFDLIVFVRGLLGKKSTANEAENVNIPSNGAENGHSDCDGQ